MAQLKSFQLLILMIDVIKFKSANDVSRGSYAIRKIKQEFAKAFRTLVAMFGVSYSTDGIIQPPTSSNTMVTLLGTILHVDRAILEHRDFLENFYYKLVTGLPSIPAPPQPKAVEFQKRKRQSDPHPEIIFIEDSTDNEKPRAKESKDLPRKKRKNAESERVAASEKSMGKKRAAASDSEDPDIAAYYGRNPNDKYLKETDGLDYSTHFDGPAFDGFNAPPASSPKKKKGKKSNPAKGKQKAKYNY